MLVETLQINSIFMISSHQEMMESDLDNLKWCQISLLNVEYQLFDNATLIINDLQGCGSVDRI